ncbi:FISUMP domain-containing protein [Saccharicrinis sp. FJH54]|uniref:FISUMP domain-containing protein n=1 Tax=Saccharicrinis sp. FJH54 TaxID=3344665 RepID=UPI0035D3FD55
MKKVVSLCFIIFITYNFARAQYYVTIKDDSTHMEIDSVVLRVENNYDLIKWQVSTDSMNWIDVDEGNTHVVWIDRVAGYRAVSKNEDCPVISDTISTGIIKVKVDNTFALDNQGKVYELPSGLNIVVPPNTVLEQNLLCIEEFDSVQAKQILPFPVDSGKSFIYAMKFNPIDTTSLLKPIKVRIPASKYNRGDLPRIFLFNSETDEWTNYTNDIICNRPSGYIEITLNKLQPFRIDAYPKGLLISEEENTQLKSISEPNFAKISLDSCYDLIRVRTTEFDMISIHKSQQCYFLEDEGTIEFLKKDCQNRPKDYWHIREISNSCIPEFEVLIDDDPNKDIIKVGDDVVLTFFTYIITNEGEKIRLPEQYVYYKLPTELISESLINMTNKDGKFSINVTATGKNLDALINSTAHFEYCLELIEARSENTSEKACQQTTKKLDVSLNKRVFIYDDCTGSDEIDCTLSSDSVACQIIKDGLPEPQSLMIMPSYRVLDFNETYQVPAYIDFKPFSSHPLASQINWSSSDNNIATIDDQGVVTAYSTEGHTYITASLCDLKITDTIEVKNIICKNSGLLKDSRDANEYDLVEIGDKIWMAENLNYYTGTGSLPNTYGRLYTWTTALTVCPSGWHLPSHMEWVQLVNVLGMNPKCIRPLPGGYYDYWGGFSYGGDNSCWWSSTETPDKTYEPMLSTLPGYYHAYGRIWNTDKNIFDWIGFYKVHALSVRCVKN